MIPWTGGPVKRQSAATSSPAVVPMRNRAGETAGVLQLINAMDGAGNVCAFSENMTLVPAVHSECTLYTGEQEAAPFLRSRHVLPDGSGYPRHNPPHIIDRGAAAGFPA